MDSIGTSSASSVPPVAGFLTPGNTKRLVEELIIMTVRGYTWEECIELNVLAPMTAEVGGRGEGIG